MYKHNCSIHKGREQNVAKAGRLFSTLCPVPTHVRVWISVREAWIMMVTRNDTGYLKQSELLYTRVRKARRNRR